MKYLFIFLLLINIKLLAQNEIKSNAGKEFILCFPKNDNNNQDSTFLALYISSNDGSKCNISVKYLLDDIEINENYSVIGNEIANIEIPSKLEISDYKVNQKKAIFVNSDNDIVVYGLSKNSYTSDAFLVYPVSICDNLYTNASWANNLLSTSIDNFSNRYSNITFVGINDNTLITIYTSSKVINNDYSDTSGPITININKGETKMMQASYKKFYDLTGSIINSNNPISVFSCHERAAIPDNDASRDVLIEHTPPVSILGTTALVTPLYLEKFKPTYIFRIIPYFDNTKISLPDRDTIINRFSFLEIITDTAFYVYSDKPVLYAQYSISAQLHEKTNQIGDPFLAFLPSKEQYLKSYKFISAPFEDFEYHYVNISIHQNGIPSLLLDNEKIPDSLFKRIGSTDYFYAGVRIKEGAHFISSDSTFGILVYGYGTWDSYGYTGGMKTERIIEQIMDNNPPVVAKNGHCNMQSSVTELNEFDTGIKDIEIIDKYNIIETIPNFAIGAKNVSLSFNLINELEDGWLIYKIQDLKGQFIHDTISIMGFTSDIIKKTITDTLKQFEFHCDTLQIINRNSFNKNYKLYFQNNTSFSIPPSYFEFELKSNSDSLFPYCIYSNNLGIITDKLVIIDECGREKTLDFKIFIENIIDELISKCKLNIKIETLESMKKELNSFGFTYSLYDINGRKVDFAQLDINPKGLFFIVISDEKDNYQFIKIFLE